MRSCSRLVFSMIIILTVSISLFIINLFTLKLFITKPEVTQEVKKEEEVKEVIPLDTKKYKKLSFKSFSVNVSDNKISWYYDKYSKQYYLLLPKYANLNNLNVNFTTESSNALVSVYDLNNKKIGEFRNNDNVNYFDNNTVILKLETNVKKKTTYKVTTIKSEISSISVNLDNGAKGYKRVVDSTHHTAYEPGNVIIGDLNNNVTYERLEKFKGRGNTTWQREKKPYALKFESKINLLGLGKSKNWTLLNNYPDGSLARNFIWYTMAKKLNLEYSVDCEPVDLYINGNYMGLYLLADKVEVSKASVNIEDNDYLFEIDNKVDEYQFRTSHGYVIKTHNPELDKMTSSERKNTLRDAKAYLNKIEKLIYGNASSEELSKYFDLESFAKYYWVQEISESLDASRGSNYMYVKDGKLYAGPIWDMDATLNRSYQYTTPRKYYVLDDSSLQWRIKNNWYRKLMKRKDFSDMVDKIYLEYQDVFNGLTSNIDEYTNKISESAKMNYIKWNYNQMLRKQSLRAWVPQNKSYKGSVNYLKSMINTRLSFYQNEYKGVLHDSVEYEVSGITGELNNTQTITLKNVKKNATIKIYSVYNGTKTLVKKLKLKDGFVKNDLYLTHKANTSYKNINRYHYGMISFKVSEVK